MSWIDFITWAGNFSLIKCCNPNWDHGMNFRYSFHISKLDYFCFFFRFQNSRKIGDTALILNEFMNEEKKSISMTIFFCRCHNEINDFCFLSFSQQPKKETQINSEILRNLINGSLVDISFDWSNGIIHIRSMVSFSVLINFCIDHLIACEQRF